MEKYVCPGGCGEVVTSEEYSYGHTMCKKEDCPNFNQPLVKKIICEKCGMYFDENEEHLCG